MGLLEIIKNSEEYVFITHRYTTKDNIKDCKKCIFINKKVYDAVFLILKPYLNNFKALLSDQSLGIGTSRYWEEEWHDKLVKSIKAITNYNESEIGNSVSCILEF